MKKFVAFLTYYSTVNMPDGSCAAVMTCDKFEMRTMSRHEVESKCRLIESDFDSQGVTVCWSVICLE